MLHSTHFIICIKRLVTNLRRDETTIARKHDGIEMALLGMSYRTFIGQGSHLVHAWYLDLCLVTITVSLGRYAMVIIGRIII